MLAAAALLIAMSYPRESRASNKVWFDAVIKNWGSWTSSVSSLSCCSSPVVLNTFVHRCVRKERVGAAGDRICASCPAAKPIRTGQHPANPQASQPMGRCRMQTWRSRVRWSEAGSPGTLPAASRRCWARFTVSTTIAPDPQHISMQRGCCPFGSADMACSTSLPASQEGVHSCPSSSRWQCRQLRHEGTEKVFGRR